MKLTFLHKVFLVILFGFITFSIYQYYLNNSLKENPIYCGGDWNYNTKCPFGSYCTEQKLQGGTCTPYISFSQAFSEPQETVKAKTGVSNWEECIKAKDHELIETKPGICRLATGEEIVQDNYDYNRFLNLTDWDMTYQECIKTKNYSTRYIPNQDYLRCITIDGKISSPIKIIGL